jgi:hypothetical protein
MTVGDLIELLKTYPVDLPVYRNDHEWGPVAARTVGACDPDPDFFTGEPRSPGLVIR